MKKGIPFFAILLILIGILMLVERAGFFDFGWTGLLWSALALLGGVKIVQGFQKPSGEGIVWGTIFLCVGTYQVLSEGGIFELPGGMLFPAFLVVIGAGFLLALIRRPREWHLAVPALVLIGFGGAMILAELELLERWQVIDGVQTWWPAALVLFGAALLLNRGTEREGQLR